MSAKEMKAYLKKYKKVHGKSISKMCKEEMMKLLHVVKQHEVMSSMPEKDFEKHVADMKKMRSIMSSKPEAKKPEPKMVRAKSVPKPHVVRVASEPHIAPIMKSSIIQKGEDEDIRYALGKPVKVEKFVVEKELTKALSPEKKSKKKAVSMGETTEHEDVEPKKKRTLSAEHLAKMRAGRAMKMAETSDPGAPMVAPVAEAKKKRVLSPEHLAKMKAGREAKKVAVEGMIKSPAGGAEASSKRMFERLGARASEMAGGGGGAKNM
jgi:hypothetical protein